MDFFDCFEIDEFYSIDDDEHLKALRKIDEIVEKASFPNGRWPMPKTIAGDCECTR